MKLRLPHPVILLLGAIAIAAAFTWLLPAGEYQRRDDPATGRSVVVAGTYQRVEAAPVRPFEAILAVPRGFAAGIDVIMTILIVGAAWVVVDKVGTLRALVGAMARHSQRSGLLAIPIASFFFASMGAVENMQEEIIALVPALMLLGRGLGVDAVTVVAMSAGAAMAGSAFGPTNPFQAGIALKLAQLPPLSGGWLRLAMFAAGYALWTWWTVRHAVRVRGAADDAVRGAPERLGARDWVILLCVLLPLVAYVVGVLRFNWDFDHLSAVFLIGGALAGLLGGLGVSGTTVAFLEGMKDMLPAASMVALARSISLVLADGRVIDTILHGLATPLAGVPGMASVLLMIPVQAALHVPVVSVSGQAALTMPIMAPLADLLGFSRQLSVLAFQTGAGVMELFTPTNGALMAILLAAGVPFGRWVRFAAGGGFFLLLVGIAGIFAAAVLGI